MDHVKLLGPVIHLQLIVFLCWSHNYLAYVLFVFVVCCPLLYELGVPVDRLVIVVLLLGCPCFVVDAVHQLLVAKTIFVEDVATTEEKKNTKYDQ